MEHQRHRVSEGRRSTAAGSAPGELELATRLAEVAVASFLGISRRCDDVGSGATLPLEDPMGVLEAFPSLGDGGSEGSRLDIAAGLERLLEETIDRSTLLGRAGYMGHQVAAPHPLGPVVEMVNAALNNGMAVYEMGQGQTAMEIRVVEFLCGRLGLPQSAGGVLTDGGSLGNFTAFLAMRQAMAGYDVWENGQQSPMSVLVSDQAHYSVSRATRMMGWGRMGAWSVPADEAYRFDMSQAEVALAEARAAGRQVVGIVGNCSTTATGSLDPLEEMAGFCRREDLWFHVDGAHAASLSMSPRLRPRIRGIEMADSVVWDLHKMMAAPALNTATLFRENRRSYEAFAQEASYLYDDGDPEDRWYDLGPRTFECTKRAMSVTAYAMIRLLGEAWFARHVERLVDLASCLAERLEAAPDFEVACAPDCNIVCFRYTAASSGAASGNLSELQARIRTALIREGRFYITQARLRGEIWLRVVVMNPKTDRRDLLDLMDAIRRLAERLG